jgi:ACT domain-containing protein
METPAKCARINQALTVLRKAQDGMTVIAACREVGIARSTFYDVCKRHPEQIEDFNNAIRANEMMELAVILHNQFNVLEEILADALDDKTKPRQRLAIKRYIDERVEQLSEKYLRHRSNPQTTKSFLNGPKLESGKSRFYTQQPVMDMDFTSGS